MKGWRSERRPPTSCWAVQEDDRDATHAAGDEPGDRAHRPGVSLRGRAPPEWPDPERARGHVGDRGGHGEGGGFPAPRHEAYCRSAPVGHGLRLVDGGRSFPHRSPGIAHLRHGGTQSAARGSCEAKERTSSSPARDWLTGVHVAAATARSWGPSWRGLLTSVETGCRRRMPPGAGRSRPRNASVSCCRRSSRALPREHERAALSSPGPGTSGSDRIRATRRAMPHRT